MKGSNTPKYSQPSRKTKPVTPPNSKKLETEPVKKERVVVNTRVKLIQSDDEYIKRSRAEEKHKQQNESDTIFLSKSVDQINPTLNEINIENVDLELKKVASNISVQSDVIVTASVIAITSAPIINATLEVSRYPLNNPVDVVITKIQEIKLQQKMIKELKFIESFDPVVLENQNFYWLFTNNIVNEDARIRIKSALETHCMMHMQWISGSELEIDINPHNRIEKIPNHKKKS